MRLRALAETDLTSLVSLLSRIENFTPHEVETAKELLDAAHARLPDEHADYRVLVAEDESALVGYVCFGPTPMTEATWDLYWIAADPTARGKGVGHALLLAAEAYAKERGGRHVRIETSSLSEYEATRRFYDRHRYAEGARLRDFYRAGDDLVTLWKVL